MIRHFRLTPGIAAYLEVRELPDMISYSVIYLSKEKGVVVGFRERSLSEIEWPLKLKAEINKHFGTVFALPHEDWKGPGPSPRAQYVDNLIPWIVEADAAI